MLGFQRDDTIVGPATAIGEGGIAIIRISGPLTLSLLTKFFRPVQSGSFEFQSHYLYFGKFIREDLTTVDEIMAVFMRQPKTYTREDVGEIHCHGNRFIIQEIIDCLLDSGARLALPGEFTFRAFQNGRIDLSQAEAVADVIQAKSLAAEKIAIGQLSGKLSKIIHGYRDKIFELVVLVEAYIDFPDDEIDPPHFHKLKSDAQQLLDEMGQLLQQFDSGRILRDGISILIIGRPNVGKSSLLNSFLGESRAIVTHIPGTTRDTIEEQIIIGGVPVRIVDTAGIRQTNDPVEAEGVFRAQKKIAAADIVLLVVDGSVSLTDEDVLAFDLCKSNKTILVINKNDKAMVGLDHEILKLPHCYISAKNDDGIDDLKNLILDSLDIDSDLDTRENVVLSDRRHREAIRQCQLSLVKFLENLSLGGFPELLAMELREGLSALGVITGESTPDDILNNIFGRFCVGK